MPQLAGVAVLAFGGFVLWRLIDALSKGGKSITDPASAKLILIVTVAISASFVSACSFENGNQAAAAAGILGAIAGWLIANSKIIT